MLRGEREPTPLNEKKGESLQLDGAVAGLSK